MEISLKDIIEARNISVTNLVKEASAGRELLGVTSKLLDDMTGFLKRRKTFNKGFNQVVPGKGTLYPDLTRELDAAYDIGLAANQVKNLHAKAELGKKSITNSYSGLFDTFSETNPLQLYRQARSKKYSPLGDDFMHSGSSLKDVAEKEMEHLVIKSLGQQADNPKVVKYMQKLVNENDGNFSELQQIAKKVKSDFADGVDATVTVPDALGRGTSLTVKVDRPIATYNGSPAFDMSKTFGLNNVESFNKHHRSLISKFDDATAKLKANSSDLKAKTEMKKAKEELSLSSHFRDRFANKLPDGATNKGAGTPQVTLNDFKSLQDVKSFFLNPLANRGVSALSTQKAQRLSDQLVKHVRGQIAQKGNSPQVIKSAIITKLDEFAKVPENAGFLDTFHFARYSPSEMKDVMNTLTGTRDQVSSEVLRLGADVGALGLGTGLAGLGITTMLG